MVASGITESEVRLGGGSLEEGEDAPFMIVRKFQCTMGAVQYVESNRMRVQR